MREDQSFPAHLKSNKCDTVESLWGDFSENWSKISPQTADCAVDSGFLQRSARATGDFSDSLSEDARSSLETPSSCKDPTPFSNCSSNKQNQPCIQRPAPFQTTDTNSRRQLNLRLFIRPAPTATPSKNKATDPTPTAGTLWTKNMDGGFFPEELNYSLPGKRWDSQFFWGSLLLCGSEAHYAK